MEPLTLQDVLQMLGDRDVTIEQLRRLVIKLETAAAAAPPKAVEG